MISTPFLSNPPRSFLSVPSSSFLVLALSPVKWYRKGQNLTFSSLSFSFLIRQGSVLAHTNDAELRAPTHTKQHAAVTAKCCQAFWNGEVLQVNMVWWGLFFLFEKEKTYWYIFFYVSNIQCRLCKNPKNIYIHIYINSCHSHVSVYSCLAIWSVSS